MPMALGTVVQYSREFCWVRLDDGPEVLAKPRGRLEVELKQREHVYEEGRQLERLVARSVAVGDRVQLEKSGDEQYVIVDIEPRETWLLRKTPGRYHRRPQCVVANADQLAVVAAPNPEVRPAAVDRWFIAALQGGVDPLLVVNKIDLDPTLPERVDLRNYRELGYRVFFTQATDGTGLEALADALRDKLTVFSGHSGVGKSSLLTWLTGQEIATAEVRPRDQKGRQTTVSARMYPLKGIPGWVVDTPGVREFGLVHFDWLDVHDYFSDIATLATGCAFRDCHHHGEPDCAVRDAVEQGRLARGRLDSYQKLRAESEEPHWKS